MEFEKERKMADDNQHKSQERLQHSIERTNHIRNTYNQAEDRLNQRINSTLDVIDRKRQQEMNMKAAESQMKKQRSMDNLMKSQD